MTSTGQIIRWSTAGAVIGVAAVAAVTSCEHAYALVRAHGETGGIGRLVPLTVDGLIYASSMVLLDAARRQVRVPALARWLLGLGIAATLAANVAHVRIWTHWLTGRSANLPRGGHAELHGWRTARLLRMTSVSGEART